MEVGVFEWLRRKTKQPLQTGDDGYARVPGMEFVTMDREKAAALAADAPPQRALSMVGKWVELRLAWEHDEPFIGFVYLDDVAGLSARGDRASLSTLSTFPAVTVRLPMPLPWRVLGADEVVRLALPAEPAWLVHYGRQPDPSAPWRHDPIISAHTHESFVNDVQVLVHDGEPRRTRVQPEQCWVRMLSAVPLPPRTLVYDAKDAKMDAAAFAARYGAKRYVYGGTLMNKPNHLTTVSEGDEIHFISADGIGKPLLVTGRYLDELPAWSFRPCNKCGMIDTLDPPSVMAKTRFPDLAENQVTSFTSFCANCGKGGMQQLLLRDRHA